MNKISIQCQEMPDVTILVPQSNDLQSLIYGTSFTKGGEEFALVLCKKDLTSAAALVMEALAGKSNTMEYKMTPDKIKGVRRSARLVNGKLELVFDKAFGSKTVIRLSQNEIKRMLNSALPNKAALKSQIKGLL